MPYYPPPATSSSVVPVPNTVATGITYTVSANTQGLFSVMLIQAGGSVLIEATGRLIEVN